ncbi:domain found in IF2B/IF5-domain-containing protein [Gaertneriomyces semiglobifer]|nr:domain found in IF2B/IF5-domain-containing protein [Gaertneriomyces semiglobifer]
MSLYEEKPVDETENFDFGLKKKKKKKKVTIVDDEAQPEEGAGEEQPAESFDFGEKKKKKKKHGLAEFEAELRSGQDEDGSRGDDDEHSGDRDAWIGTNRDYTYPELLSRVFKVLRQKNPEAGGEKKRYTIAPPQVIREGTKKSVFANVVDICKRMHRQPDHVIQYLFAELGTTGSIDGSQRLVIKGRFQPKQIENVIKRYFMEYVTCKTCKSADTILTKENRLFFLQCEACGSTRTVSAIKTGFIAQTRDARKAARAQA